MIGANGQIVHYRNGLYKVDVNRGLEELDLVVADAPRRRSDQAAGRVAGSSIAERIAWNGASRFPPRGWTDERQPPSPPW